MASKLMYRTSEAADTVGLSRSKLYELMARGEIESVTVGKNRLIPHSALEAFVARLRTQAADDQSSDAAE